jgi:hypothetical protein
MGSNRRFPIVAVLAILLAGPMPLKAAEHQDGKEDWTVVTMARDGSWGVATDSLMGRAISAAMRDCRAMSGEKSDCGAEFRVTRSGWILALLCSDHKVLASAKQREDAEANVRLRIDLKRAYIPDLPLCRIVLTVDPRGAIVPADDLRASANMVGLLRDSRCAGTDP